jgi:hypothetical protein
MKAIPAWAQGRDRPNLVLSHKTRRPMVGTHTLPEGLGNERDKLVHRSSTVVYAHGTSSPFHPVKSKGIRRACSHISSVTPLRGRLLVYPFHLISLSSCAWALDRYGKLLALCRSSSCPFEHPRSASTTGYAAPLRRSLACASFARGRAISTAPSMRMPG